MTRKVVISPEDFSKIADFIHAMPIPFSMVEQACEVKKALKGYQLIDLEIKDTPNIKDNERG